MSTYIQPVNKFSNNKFVKKKTPVVIMFLSLLITSCSYSTSKQFDANKWKREVELRYQMVENLIDSKILTGMTKEEVIEMLGSDSEEGPCNNCIGYDTNKPNQGFSIDHEVLEIDFDDQNKVANFRINAW